ncbi:MAG: hypothetical protein H5T78_13620 [Nocardia sp.]|nr:hypothetical protein [Nocardia sp.]
MAKATWATTTPRPKFCGHVPARRPHGPDQLHPAMSVLSSSDVPNYPAFDSYRDASDLDIRPVFVRIRPGRRAV